MQTDSSPEASTPALGVHRSRGLLSKPLSDLRSSRKPSSTQGIPGVGQLLSAQALPLVLVAVINVALVIALKPSERGRAAFIVSTGSLTASIAWLNMHIGVVASYRGGDLSAVRRGALVSASTASCLCVLAVAAALTRPHLGHVDASDLALSLVGAALYVGSLYVARTLQALGDASAYLLLTLLQTLTYGIVIVALLALRQLTATGAATAWGTGSAVALLAGCIKLRPFLKRVESAQHFPVLPAALNAHLALCAYQLLYRCDIVILALVATSMDVGRYAVAVAVAESVWQVAEALALSAFATGLKETTGDERRLLLKRHLRAYRRLAFPLGVASLAGMLVFVYVFVPSYRPSAGLLVLLLPGVLFGGELRIRLAALNADRAASGLVRKMALLAFATCALYVPAIMTGGAAGAAVASTAVYTINAVAARLVSSQPHQHSRQGRRVLGSSGPGE